jgi:hypothetical protein
MPAIGHSVARMARLEPTRPADADGLHRLIARRLAGIPSPLSFGAGPLRQPARREYASCRQQAPLAMGRAVLAGSVGRRARPPGRSAPERSPGGLAARTKQSGGSLRSRLVLSPPPPPSGERGELRRKASPPRRPAAARVGPLGQARAPSPARPSWRDAAGIVPAGFIAYIQSLTCISRMRELRKTSRKPGFFAVFGLKPSAASWYTGVPFGAIGALE